MATEAQIRANRENAKKSCGPRTEAGKEASRLNALKHGLCAGDIFTMLPHEDPLLFKAKLEAWVNNYKPTNTVELELVTRAAHLSLILDRAARYETALASRQVRQAMVKTNARRIEEVCFHTRRLLYMTGPREYDGAGPDWVDNPAADKAHLEATPEGVRWLRDRWIEVRCLQISEEDWTFNDEFRFFRLMGKHPIEAMNDPELNEILLAWEVMDPGWGEIFWNKMQEKTPEEDPAFSKWIGSRELVPRPESFEAATAFVQGIANCEIDRLDALIADLDEIECMDALDLAEQASFVDTAAGERLHRYVTSRTRELHRTIELLMKLRKAEADARSRAAKEAREVAKRAPNGPNRDRGRPRRPDLDPRLAEIYADPLSVLDRILTTPARPSHPPQPGPNEPKSPSPPPG